MSIRQAVHADMAQRTEARLPASAVRWGVATVIAMAALYVGVLLVASGAGHLRTQWTTYWWLLVPLWLLGGIQVSLISSTPRRHGRRSRHGRRVRGAAMSTGSTAAGMLACCAHHAAELLPVVGVAGLASALVAWQVRILIAAVLISAFTTANALRRWRANPALPQPLQPLQET